MKKKELQELIKQGEGYFVEFKEHIGVGLDKEMVAFANASGGKIVMGVADNPQTPQLAQFVMGRLTRGIYSWR